MSRGPAQVALFDLANEHDATVRLAMLAAHDDGIVYTLNLSATDSTGLENLGYEAQGLREDVCLTALERLTIWLGEPWCDACFGTQTVEGYFGADAACGNCCEPPERSSDDVSFSERMRDSYEATWLERQR